MRHKNVVKFLNYQKKTMKKVVNLCIIKEKYWKKWMIREIISISCKKRSNNSTRNSIECI